MFYWYIYRRSESPFGRGSLRNILNFFYFKKKNEYLIIWWDYSEQEKELNNLFQYIAQQFRTIEEYYVQ
uniref:ORF68a n=1 Tax=Pinus koraiensis TaxID=88728 RepID=Q85X68_PINKO|nr:ORF68a [Pinus koraiensis]